MKLHFKSEKEKRQIQKEGLLLERKGLLKPKAIELGQKFRNKIESGVLPKVFIRFINENIGHGAFLEERLKKGEFAGEYTGLVRENEHTYFAPLNNYLMEYPVNDRLGRSFVVDATHGNICRFYNHSTKPNLQIQYAYLDGFYHVILLTLRSVKKGEQLTYDYGSNYWLLRDPPEEFH